MPNKGFADIQVTKECRFTLRRPCDIIKTHRKYVFLKLHMYERAPNRIWRARF